MRKYTVERDPGGGWHIRIDPPPMTSGWEDIEGVGMCRVTPRAVHHICHFDKKRDADEHVRRIANGDAWAPGRD